jgi:hypothetical protein
MKDTVHAAVHRSVHLFGKGKSYGALRLRITRPLILDTGKTPEWAGATPLRCHGNRGGRSSPPKGSRQQKEAPCAAASSENPGGASEEGKNCSLRFWASLISSPNEAGSCQKRRGMSDMTNRKVTEKKRLNRAVATPLFGGPSAQKFRGVATARHAGSVTV